jgi:small GTP-binding protein
MTIEEKSYSRGKVVSKKKMNVHKIIIGGDGGIGKTTLLKVLCGEGYSNQDMTIGFEIYTKDIFINGSKEVLQIWDLSGQDHFRFLLPDYFKGAHGVVLGFDMSRRTSFLNLRTWMSILISKCPNAAVVLIATKADLGYHPTLSHMLAEDFVQKFKMIDFIEVSSKNNMNLEIPFVKLLENIKGLTPGALKITFFSPGADEICETLERSPLSEITNSNDVSLPQAEPPKVESKITQCPYCDHPLRDAQISLLQAGRKVLCQNCYKMI